MGAILEITEYFKSPVAWVILIAVVAGGYYFYKWVTAEHEDESQK